MTDLTSEDRCEWYTDAMRFSDEHYENDPNTLHDRILVLLNHLNAVESIARQQTEIADLSCEAYLRMESLCDEALASWEKAVKLGRPPNL